MTSWVMKSHTNKHTICGSTTLKDVELNMKKPELIKPKLNPPYVWLCREEIKKHLSCLEKISQNTWKIRRNWKKRRYRCKNPQVPAHHPKATRLLSKGSTGHILQSYMLGHMSNLPTAFFSQQPGTKGCPHQTIHSSLKGLMKDKVREQVTFIVDADFLSQLLINFKAGYVKDYITNWKSVTTNSVILDAIQHHIEFEGHCRPVQATKPRQIIFFIWGQRNHKPWNSLTPQLRGYRTIQALWWRFYLFHICET